MAVSKAFSLSSPSSPGDEIVSGSFQVEVASSWGKKIRWSKRNDLVPVNCQLYSGFQGIDSFSFIRRYGLVRQPDSKSEITEAPEDLQGKWVRFSIEGTPHFQGLIGPEDREINGAQPVETGMQQWTAYGGGWLLRRRGMNGAVAFPPGDVVEEPIPWIPSMNRTTQNDRVQGNRSIVKIPNPETQRESFLYSMGDAELWTNAQYIEYLLIQFMEQKQGPRWSLKDESGYLEKLHGLEKFQATTTIEQMIMQLIPQELGLDYAVMPSSTGYEIKVFSLFHEDVKFAEFSYPKNTRQISINASGRHEMDVQVSIDTTNQYDKITILGNRTISCFSVEGFKRAREQKTEEGTGWWAKDEEDAYKDGTRTAGDPAANHDAARTSDQFANVYSRFIAARNFNTSKLGLEPFLDISTGEPVSGKFVVVPRFTPRTLSRLPLRWGIDYSSTILQESDDSNVSLADGMPRGVDGDFRPPFLVLKDTYFTTARYIYSEMLAILGKWQGNIWAGGSVTALENEWGLRVDAVPRHVLAKNHFDTNDADTNDSNFDAPTDGLDYEDNIMTIAIEGVQRLNVTYENPKKLNDHSWLKIEAPGEFWWLAPGTIIDVKADGTVSRGPADGMVLRSDAEKFRRMMPGLIARYGKPRGRMSATTRRIVPFIEHLGSIVKDVVQGKGAQRVLAPVTSIVYTMSGKNLSTTIKAGHAM